MKVKFKHSVLLISFILQIAMVQGQDFPGLPAWPVPPKNDAFMNIIDWTQEPPETETISMPFPGPATDVAVGVNCGTPTFFVKHTGVRNEINQLFIYSFEGDLLLGDTTPNGPGLNSNHGDHKMQVIPVVEKINQWYIIYSKFQSDNGAINGNGMYEPSEQLYSRIKLIGNELEILERDVELQANNYTYTCSHGKAAYFNAGSNEFDLYLCRKSENYDYISIDRFIIDGDGIHYSMNTGNVSIPWWYQSILGTSIEISPDGSRLALNTRNESDGITDIVLFNGPVFNNSNIQKLCTQDLMLQPDGIILNTPMSVYNVSNSINDLLFIHYLQYKITGLEFSFDGRYLYFVTGGYPGSSGKTHITYVGQIDLGNKYSPTSYPYDLRIQIQQPPEYYNPNTGAGPPSSTHVHLWHNILRIEKARDGRMYFTKAHESDKLYVIPEPDQPMAINLVPGEVDISTSGHPNIVLSGEVLRMPDQIDGYFYDGPGAYYRDFLDSVPTLCPGDQYVLEPIYDFASYYWQDGSTDSVYLVTAPGLYWLEVEDFNGCTGRDSVYVEYGEIPEVNLGQDTVICSNGNLWLSAGTNYTSYLWQDGSTEPNYFVSQPGIYWIEVSNACGSDSDTISIDMVPGPTVSLGNDTSFCYGHFTTLNAGSGFDSYLWNTGSTDSSITAYLAGNYWVIVTDSNGCTASDTMTISASNAFELSIGNDTAVCEGDYIFLNAGDGFTSYIWQDSSTHQTFVADQEGVYWVDVFDSSGCGARDSLVLSNLPSPNPFIGSDTSICPGHTILLDPGSEFDFYVWHDGSQQQYFYVDTAGTFWVEVIDSNGCTGRGYIDIAWKDNILPDIPDTSACFGESVRFSPGPDFETYLWSDGSTDSVLMAQEEGSYWVKVLTSCGEATDTFALDYYQEIVVRLGNDTSICADETILLDPGPGFDSYLWQNGDQNQVFNVTERGIYWVQVSDGKCQATDTILIDHCPDITVPNVFTPNGDQYNDYFYAIGEYTEQFHLMVFNRWGQLLFETNDMNEKWDGKNNGTKCPQGTYFWVVDCRYYSLNGDFVDHELKGTVTLIR